MKIAYFDCSSGISGDMFLAALIDAGLPLAELETALFPLGLGNFGLKTAKVMKAGFSATALKVESKEQGAVRSWGEIEEMLSKAPLKARAKEVSLAIFSLLAEAEAKVHGVKVKDVHFHELGAVDSIVDIIGAAVGVDYFGIEAFHSSAVRLGSGRIASDHGDLPVPAPATLELLKGAAVFGGDEPFEMTTPTGAAILKATCPKFGPIPKMRATQVGLGAGSYDLSFPNIFRLIIGETNEESQPTFGPDEVLLIETNIDDLEPKLFGHVIERLFAAGALDVWLTPIYMKKMRPAVKLSALTARDKSKAVSEAVFFETGSLGLRSIPVERERAEREVIWVETAVGKIGVKVGRYGGRIISASPEYEDCKEAALRQGLSIKRVYEEAKANALRETGEV